MKRYVKVLSVALLATSSAVMGRPLRAQLTPSEDGRVSISALVGTSGPRLEPLSSQHFVLYSGLAPRKAAEMLDSLENALEHAKSLLETEVHSSALVPVFVVSDPARFAPLLSARSKGFRGMLSDGSSFIVLVVNDSVRAYTRHEVMHDVAFKAWGNTRAELSWLSESLATFADGKCQGYPNSVVARDLLAERADLTLEELVSTFWAIAQVSRHTAYVLGATVVEFMWKIGGISSVRRLWQLGEWPNFASLEAKDSGQTMTSAWRSYIAQTAGTQLSLEDDAFRRNGCG